MSQRADIYLLKGSAQADCISFCIKLTEKALALGHLIHIVTRTPSESEQISRSMWGNPVDSFLPNKILEQADQDKGKLDSRTSVTISELPTHSGHRDLLMLMPGTFDQAATDFARVALITPNNPAEVNAARKAYKSLSQHASPVNIHDMRKP